MIIQPNRLKTVRIQKGWSRAELAHRSKVSLRQIVRLESDQEEHRRVRVRTVHQLCEAMKIDPSVLTSEVPPVAPQTDRDKPPKGQVNLAIDSACRNALALIARRYNVTQQQIVEVAPLLFLIIAEQSLSRRRGQIEQLLKAVEEANSCVPRHLNDWRSFVEENENSVAAEEQSINERNLFGKGVGRWTERSDADNPFARYLSEILSNLPVPHATISNVAVRWELGEEPHYRIGLEELDDMLGKDKAAWEPVLNGNVVLAEMPFEIRRADPASRANWVKEQALAQEGELTEFLKNFDGRRV